MQSKKAGKNHIGGFESWGWISHLAETDRSGNSLYVSKSYWVVMSGMRHNHLDFSIDQIGFQRCIPGEFFLFVTGPLLLIELGYCSWKQKRGERLPGWNHAVVVIYGIALCLFGVFRNLV